MFELESDDFIDSELGGRRSRRRRRRKKRKSKRKARRSKRKTRRRKILRKIGKGVAAVATGGLSVALDKKARRFIKKRARRIIKRKPLRKAISKIRKTKAKAKAKKVIRKVTNKKAGDCKCENELAKLVAAKLVKVLGPPLDRSSQILAKLNLQRQATYEHKKLMTDSEFRRKVLAYLSFKASQGNQSCKRALIALR